MLAGLGHVGDALRYHVLACVLLPAAFALAAWLAPGAGHVAVAWAWAASYPIVFGVLLERALVRGRVRLASYLRSVAGVVVCGAGAALGAIAVQAVLPGPRLGRLVAVAAVIVAIYTGLIARIERITPRSILRMVRGMPEGT